MAQIEAFREDIAEPRFFMPMMPQIEGFSGIDSSDLQRFEERAASVFGYAALRPEQRHSLSVILANPRSLVTMPTGGGKSLLYGLLALEAPGLTVVVSPLTALKREQAQLFRQAGLCAAHLSFDQDRDERESIWAMLLSGSLKLLFVSPERFVSEAFQSRLRRADSGGHPLSCLFVDEAHCMATWGYGFRPEYRQIGEVLKSWRLARVVALTATAGKRTRSVIKGILGRVTGELISRPLRSNIEVGVVRVRSEVEREIWLEGCFQAAKAGRKTIVYVQRRVDAERYATIFRKPGLRTVCYHAGLGARARGETEEYIRSSREPLIIFATQAYGMGINLPEVDHVVVCGYPSGIEELIQMIGRSGRSGGSAQGTLIWNGADPVRRMHALRSAHPLSSSLRRLLIDWQKRHIQCFPGQSMVLHSRRDIDSFLSQQLECKEERFREQKRAQVSEGELWKSEAFIHALRLANVIEEVELGSPLVAVISLKSSQILEAQKQFSVSDTQRGRVLSALAERYPAAEIENRPGIEAPIFFCFPLYELQTRTRLSLSQLQRVCDALSGLIEGLTIQIFSSLSSNVDNDPLFISAPGILDVERTIAAYEELRAERLSGFQVLDRFARATGCRLQSVFTYFDGKDHDPCGQCDFCNGQQMSSNLSASVATEPSHREK